MEVERPGPGSTSCLVVLVCAGALGCYRPLAPLTSPEDKRAWVARLGVEAPVVAPDEGVREPHCAATLDEAALAALAVARDPEIARLEAEARALEASAQASRARAPELRMNNFRLDEVVRSEPRFELGLRVPFERPGTLAAEADALRQEGAIVRARAGEVARELRREVLRAVARHAGGLAIAETARAEVERAGREIARLSAGAATQAVEALALAEAEVALAEARSAVALAEAEAARWGALVAARCGCVPEPGVALRWPERWPNDRPGARDELHALALAQRPSLDRRAAELGVAHARAHEARALMWPWLDWVQLGYELTEPVAADTWVFSLALAIPIGAWDGEAFEAVETHRRGIVEAARRDAIAIGAEVDAALGHWQRCDDALAALAHARSGIDRQRLAALDDAVARGLADPADVHALARDLARIERRRLEALVLLREARIELEYALGRR